ncbi:hypothetical protein VKT23_012745 [Stygiomarasmius scandens]|uniref:Uncharacterized protein n=1 Tax=Marasmiellus scandens TaxID=2682957 RepID=A0ABR1JAI5_9AGAR
MRLSVLTSTGSREIKDVEDTLATLSVTNIAYCVTTLFLGYKSPPELTLYDDAACNYERRSSLLFVPVSMQTFRITGLALSTFFLAFGTTFMIIDNTLLKKQWRQQDYFVTNSPNIDKIIAMRFTSNTIVFGFCIGHVETLRLFNNPEQSDQSWGFGQILPVFLTALPAMRVLSLFRERMFHNSRWWQRRKSLASSRKHSRHGSRSSTHSSASRHLADTDSGYNNSSSGDEESSPVDSTSTTPIQDCIPLQNQASEISAAGVAGQPNLSSESVAINSV